MIEGANPVVQALLGTLLTWGLTAAGAACVILVIGYQVGMSQSLFKYVIKLK